MTRVSSWVMQSVAASEYRHCECGKILSGGPRYDCPVCKRAWKAARPYAPQPLEELQWPLCLGCYGTLGKPALSRVPPFPLEGPAKERIDAGMCDPNHEYCTVCGTATIAGVYLREWPRKEIV